MQTLSAKLDQQLIALAWSLWTELGVAGVVRKHQKFLIAPEELILLTATIAETDPRLRDEALDWCTRFHHFISISRLRTLAKPLINVSESFSEFAATLNSVCRAKWPLLTLASPIKFTPSGKSKPPKYELPALLCFRLRGLFGVGARADLIMFFLTQKKNDFAVSDVTEIGYSKRALAEVLEGFTLSGIFDGAMVRNQRRYHFAKRDLVLKFVGPLPEFILSWRYIIEVLLTLRACILSVEKKSDNIKVVEIRNILISLKDFNLYIGYTTDVEQRLKTHNSGGSIHTKQDRPWKLVAYLAFDTENIYGKYTTTETIVQCKGIAQREVKNSFHISC